MSLSQFDFWSRLNAKIGEARDKALSALDNGVNAPEAALKANIARRSALSDVQTWAQEVYNDMNGIPNDPPPAEEPDDGMQL